MSAPHVVKLGGALWGAGGVGLLREVGAVLRAAAATRPVLVVPGGGPFANAVRTVDAAAGLPDETAHRLAILAMEQYGRLLLALIDGASATRTFAPQPGELAVLLPAELADEPALPASWEVTSDSIAAWVAARAGAREVVLVKSVAGLIADWPDGDRVVAELDATELEQRQAAGTAGVVDAWLPTALRRFGVEAWLVDGRAPATLAATLAGEAPPATRISAA